MCGAASSAVVVVAVFTTIDLPEHTAVKLTSDDNDGDGGDLWDDNNGGMWDDNGGELWGERGDF